MGNRYKLPQGKFSHNKYKLSANCRNWVWNFVGMIRTGRCVPSNLQGYKTYSHNASYKCNDTAVLVYSQIIQNCLCNTQDRDSLPSLSWLNNESYQLTTLTSKLTFFDDVILIFAKISRIKLRNKSQGMTSKFN
jgi:hypothetical protein